MLGAGRDADPVRGGLLAHSAPLITGYILFALLGLVLGYAAPGRYAWLALLAPVGFFFLNAFTTGVDGGLVVMFLIALAITAAAVLAGKALDARLAQRRAAS